MIKTFRVLSDDTPFYHFSQSRIIRGGCIGRRKALTGEIIKELSAKVGGTECICVPQLIGLYCPLWYDLIIIGFYVVKILKYKVYPIE